jgi:hypothetical protein
MVAVDKRGAISQIYGVHQTGTHRANQSSTHGLINQAQMGSYQSDIDGINQWNTRGANQSGIHGIHPTGETRYSWG